MIQEINTVEDVRTFARDLTKEGINFHPDDDFNEYINYETGKDTFSKEEADFRNILMDKCFEICEKENACIYEIMHTEFLLESGLNEIIPLP